jgi:hypothetical protein
MLSRSLVSLTKDFFQAVRRRSFTEAERTLETIKSKAKATEWYKGYINALEGMITSLKTNDTYALINRVKADEVKKLIYEFNEQSKYTFHKEFDRGFFDAWVDYLETLS